MEKAQPPASSHTLVRKPSEFTSPDLQVEGEAYREVSSCFGPFLLDKRGKNQRCLTFNYSDSPDGGEERYGSESINS